MPQPAIHRGEHLADELVELNMSAAALARQSQVPTNCITRILNGRRDFMAGAALRLAHFIGASAEFRINLQIIYDLYIAQQDAGKTIKALPTLKPITASNCRLPGAHCLTPITKLDGPGRRICRISVKPASRNQVKYSS
jgi:addiction module HigA family antidote